MDIVEFVEKLYGISLLEYQKEVLRNLYKNKVYYTYRYPRFVINQYISSKKEGDQY
jgi:hypothetical protein